MGSAGLQSLHSASPETWPGTSGTDCPVLQSDQPQISLCGPGTGLASRQQPEGPLCTPPAPDTEPDHRALCDGGSWGEALSFFLCPVQPAQRWGLEWVWEARWSWGWGQECGPRCGGTVVSSSSPSQTLAPSPAACSGDWGILAVIYTLVGLGQPALSFRSGPRSPRAYWVPALGDMLDAAWLPEAGGVPAAPVSKMRRLRLREVNLPGVFPQVCWGHDLTWEGLPPPRTAVGVMAAV